MAAAEQYRAKAAECNGLLDDSRSPGDAKDARNLDQINTTMADNEEWLARNADKVVSASDYDAVPAAQPDRNGPAILVGEHEHVLRCLGAAVTMRWSTLPAKLQRELFDYASSLDDFDRDDSISAAEQTVKLKGRIARLLHRHNGEQVQ